MIVGIDLGTTNSLVSVWRDGRAELIPNGLGSVLTPSVVSLDRTGELLVGAAARERLTSHPDLTAAAFKRAMGTGRSFRLGERKFRPEELSSFVLRALKADAEAFLGAPVREAVITVPAYFNDAQRRATKSAGALADLVVERVLNEPTAAALAYGLQQQEHEHEGKILVFDLGGGTFDVSVLELFSGVMEVRATAGDNFLGGEDFDRVIAAWFAESCGQEMPDEAAADAGERREAALLREAARAARHALSSADRVTMQAPLGTSRAAELTAEDFRTLAAPLLDRLRRPVARALADSRIRREELSQVVLAGGATRMPIVRSLAAQLFGRLPLHRIDPDEVVARGAAVQAGLKMRDVALAETVLTDVAPYTLGIEVAEQQPGGGMASGRLLPIIERNTVVPVSRSTEVIPTADFTEKVVIKIHQGESRLVADDIPLGTLDLPLQPRRRAEQAIEIRFTYDINGILEVTARCRADGAAGRVVITQHAGVMTEAEVEARIAELASLKLPPREAAANRLLLARAERRYEEALGEERRRLGAAIAAYEAALKSEEPSAIAAAATALHDAIAAAAP